MGVRDRPIPENSAELAVLLARGVSARIRRPLSATSQGVPRRMALFFQNGRQAVHARAPFLRQLLFTPGSLGILPAAQANSTRRDRFLR